MSSSNKRYYWLKLKEDFFEDDTIQWLEEQDNGKDYVIFYLKLALRSLDDNGRLVRYVGETLIPYDVPALSKLTGTSSDTVAVAMKTFLKIGLISQLESGEIYMNQIDEMTGSETRGAEKMRRLRAEKKARKQVEAKDCNNVTKSYPELLDIEIDTELEKDKDIDKEEEKKSNKKKGRKYTFDDTQYELAKLLWGKVQSNFPNNKEPNLEAWANDLRLMMEQDKRTVAQIKAVIEWSQKHEFWYANIQSARKLREKYETMYAQADRERKQGRPGVGKKESLPDWANEENESVNDKEASEEDKINVKERLEKIRAMRAGEKS